MVTALLSQAVLPWSRRVQNPAVSAVRRELQSRKCASQVVREVR